MKERMKPGMKRRHFIRLACMSGLIPLVDLHSGRAFAAPSGEVSVDEPLAKSLNYVLDASESKEHPKYKEGSDCSNCMFFKPEMNNGCALFSNRPVRKEGWCQSWVAQPN